MSAIGVIFESHLLRPNGDWNSCIQATMREDFRDWMLEFIGNGYEFPVRGWNQSVTKDVEWAWYDDRLSSVDTRKWKKHGFKVLFLDPRKAVLAKLTWGGRDLT